MRITCSSTTAVPPSLTALVPELREIADLSFHKKKKNKIMMYGSNGYLKIMILTLLLDRYIGTKKKRKNNIARRRANICDGRERSIFLPSSSADGLCFRGEEREERVKSSAFIQLKYNTTCYNVDTLSILLFLRIFPMLFVKELVHIVL